jgi:hypothetical protein
MMSVMLSTIASFIALTLAASGLAKLTHPSRLRLLYGMATAAELLCACAIIVVPSTGTFACAAGLFAAFSGYRFLLLRRKAVCSCVGVEQDVQSPEVLGTLVIAAVCGLASWLAYVGVQPDVRATATATVIPVAVLAGGRLHRIAAKSRFLRSGAG